MFFTLTIIGLKGKFRDIILSTLTTVFLNDLTINLGDPMKLTCILGSPRMNGNSAILANYFVEKAESFGATCKKYYLNGLNYKGCQGCLTCKSKLDKCVLQDEISEILDEIHETDVLVVASSVYYGDLTSQTKGFIDRFYAYYTPDFFFSSQPSRLNPGKKLVMILAQANPDQSQSADIFPRYNKLLGVYGFDDNYVIRACGVFSKGDVEKNEEVFQMTDNIVEKILA